MSSVKKRKIQFCFFLSKLGMPSSVLYLGKNLDVMVSAGTDHKGEGNKEREDTNLTGTHLHTLVGPSGAVRVCTVYI